MNIKKYFFVLASLFSFLSFGQNDYRTWIKGKVLYKNVNVEGANVINNSSQRATTTNNEGEFEIEVKLNDKILFSSVQYQIREIIITKEILQRNRIVVDVNEKVTALDEVVVTPENKEKFLDLKEEEFKRFDYSSDKSTRVVNVINEQGKLRDGLNFVNLYKLIANTINKKSNEESSSFNYSPSDLIREVYDDVFFIESLGIRKDKINEFLIYCDENFPSKILLKKDKEFELIDFLVKQSKKFNKIVN
ncbi:MAG: carboxypeptidase-like regulatory domain-containing protein [Bacteroidota bacterium]|nr:carboxypeptidase-like regulatory domain-containing protein [Bacteroidota bacterium]